MSEGVEGRDPSFTCAKSLRTSELGRGLFESDGSLPERPWALSAVVVKSLPSESFASGLTLLTKSGRGMLKVCKSTVFVS